MKVGVYDGTTFEYQGFETSNGDGTVTVYTSASSDYVLELKVDGGSTTVGSAIYDGPATDSDPAAAQVVAGARLTSGTQVTFTADSASITELGTLTMPAGGELKGKIYKTTATAGNEQANAIVQVRGYNTLGGGGGFRFVSTRTQKDGSYSISLPPGTTAYSRVCAFLPTAVSPCPTTASGTGFASANSVAVTASSSTTQDITIP